MTNDLIQQALGLYNSNPNGVDKSLFDILISNLGGGKTATSSFSPAGAPSTQKSNTGTSTGTGFLNNPGYGWDYLDQLQAQEAQLQTQSEAAAKQLAQLQADYQKQIAEINNAAAMARQKSDEALRKELQAGQITSTEFQQKQALAQQESEFARTIALQKLQEEHNYEIQKAQVAIQQATLGLSKSADARAERELQARMASNPADFVAYEFYKRQLGQPSSIGQDTGNVQQNTNPDFQQSSNDFQTPGSVPSINPAYSDSSLSSVASSLFSPTGAGYNPNLGGKGVFGATIPSPNKFSRAEASKLSQSEFDILGSFLKGGINIGGKQVAIDPNDWLQQAQNSWIPQFGTQGKTAPSYQVQQMNQYYEQLAQSVYSNTQSPGQASGLQSYAQPLPISNLKKYLGSKQGKDATRAAIDRIIANKKMTGTDPQNIPDEIFRALMSSMQQGIGYG